MQTVADLMTGRNELLIVKWTDEDTTLRLLRIGIRIDLVDTGCADTGTDCSAWTMPKLRHEVENWLRCIEADEPDRASAMQYFDRQSAEVAR